MAEAGEVGEDAAGEALVTDERVDEVTAEGGEHTRSLGPAGGDADDVGDLHHVGERDAQDVVLDGAVDRLTAGGEVASRQVTGRLVGPELLLLLGREVEAGEDRGRRAVARGADADEREVGLAGELRQAAHAPRRLAEAARLGFRRAVVPANSPDGPPGLRLSRVATLAEAVAALAVH